MIDNVDGVITRDNILQYLAMYTATKGLIYQADQWRVHDYFIQYKRMIKKHECSLEWLARDILTKYGTEPDMQPMMQFIPFPGTSEQFQEMLKLQNQKLGQPTLRPESASPGNPTATALPPEIEDEMDEEIGKAIQAAINKVVKKHRLNPPTDPKPPTK